ncbi:hypothetical protein Bb109J_c1523 [Bdellovibrio bacteriovorus]|uniref:lipopolysaccharide biosynthesis protein n=1 Tax=Bdellovibrio bacteriovorus TaxID=959 RepID=UPI00045BF4E0|nr:oligosaccharide flippase family protein [Bdellovibrio bacteriovorus]AHZ84218.1 hypothetical protein EP01_04580 [Bdellovibrio bacteriovorus]BEV68103.1 hypothetical protein Bb109J_c1523 [Bdellovibrio bacteriovorus]
MNKKQAFYFSLGPLVTAAVSIVTVPIIAWFYSQEDVGKFSLYQTITGFVLLVVTFGLDQAFVREYHEVKDRAKLLIIAFLPSLVFLTVLLPPFILFRESITSYAMGSSTGLSAVSLYFSFFLMLVLRFVSLVVRMREDGKVYSLIQVVPKILFLAMVLITFCFSLRRDADTLVLANVVALFVISVFVVAFYRREIFVAIRSIEFGRDDLEYLIVILKYSLPLAGVGLIFWGLSGVERVLLKEMSSYQELALYSVSASFASVAMIFQSVFSVVWSPLVYRWSKDLDGRKKISRAIKLVSIIVLLLWSFTGAAAYFSIFFLPEKYALVRFIMLSAIAYPFLYTLSEATSVGINLMRQTRFSFYSTAISVLVNVILGILLIKPFGALGASVSSSIAFLCFFVLKNIAAFLIYQREEFLRSWVVIITLVLLGLTPLFAMSDLIFTLFVVLFFVVIYLYRREMLLYYRWCRIWRKRTRRFSSI